MENPISERLELIKKTMVSVGFTAEEVDSEIQKVGKIIVMAILHRLIKERSDEGIRELTPQNLEHYLKTNFNTDHIRSVIEYESDNIANQYMAKVSV